VTSRAGQLSSLLTTTPLHGFRNKIINGNFDIWQRGTSQAGLGYGSADRWKVNGLDPSGAFLVSRQEFDLGQTDVPGNPRYYIRIAGSSFSATALNLAQAIEGVQTLAGQKATLTFWARASAPRQLYPRPIQDFGSGGSPSSPVDTFGDPVNLTTSWQKFSQVFDLPSIADKVLGTNGNDRLTVAFDIKRGEVGTDLGNDTIDLARVSLVEGDATAEADPFSPRHIQQELALCQRYCRDVNELTCAGFSATTAIGVVDMSANPMRGAPSASLITAGNLVGNGGSVAVTSIATVTASAIAARFDLNVSSGLTASASYNWRAGRIRLESEL